MAASCVLFSGGLDSAVLLAMECREHGPIWPVHVRAGLAWEDAERRTIDRLLGLPAFGQRVGPIASLGVDMRDIYPASHWAVAGRPPAYDTPDEDVYLEGRNIVLLSKAAVYCARLGIERIALGLLAGNPFPDATPEFFAAAARTLTLGLGRTIAIATPLTGWHKDQVIRHGLDLGVPLEATLSCMNPTGDDGHCGACSKCRERQDAYRAAGIPDPTIYAVKWKRQV